LFHPSHSHDTVLFSSHAKEKLHREKSFVLVQHFVMDARAAGVFVLMLLFLGNPTLGGVFFLLFSYLVHVAGLRDDCIH
jgi:hypothetical protein